MRRDSISSISSSASDLEESIQIFVKDIAGNTTPLSLPATTSIETVTSLLALRLNLPPSTLRLAYAGRPLASTSTLAESHLSNHSTVTLSLPLRGGMAPNPRRRHLCAYTATKTASTTDAETGAVKVESKKEKCKEQAQRIVGECGFCGGAFCSKHRLLEAHECPGLEDCKMQDRERNAHKLESERTIAIRGI